MWGILRQIKHNLSWFIIAMMVLGIITGNLFAVGFLSWFIIPLTVLMIYPMMVSMNLRSLAHIRDYPLQGLTMAINFLFIPFLGFGIGWLFFSETPYLIFALLLIALLPTSGMTISWTAFAGGRTQAAVRMTVIGLIAGVLLTPLYGYVLMGRMVEIPLFSIMKQISLIIIIPLVLGALTRVGLRSSLGTKRFDEHIQPNVPLVSLIGMLGVIFSAMALKAEVIVSNPLMILELLPPVLLFYFLNYTLITLLAKALLNKEDAIALVFGTVMRNLSIALAIALSVFSEQGPEMALLISLAYVIQIKSAALYVKFAGKRFLG